MAWRADGIPPLGVDPNLEPLLHERLWPRHSVALAVLFKLMEPWRDIVVCQDVCQALMDYELPESGVIQHETFNLPQDVTVLRNGTLVVSDRDAPGLHLVTVSGLKLRSVVIPELDTPLGIGLLSDGGIAVCNFTSGSLCFLSTGTWGLVHVTGGFPMPKHVVEVTSRMDLIVACAGSSQLSVVRRGGTDAEPLMLDRTLVKPGAMAYHPRRNELFVLDMGCLALYAFSPPPDAAAGPYRCRRMWDLKAAAAKAGVQFPPLTTFDGLTFVPVGASSTASSSTGRSAAASGSSEGWENDEGEEAVFSETAGRRLFRLHLTSGISALTNEGRRGTHHGEFDYPVGMALLPYRKLLVLDRGNSRLQILQL